MKLGSITFAENWECILTKSLTKTSFIIFDCELRILVVSEKILAVSEKFLIVSEKF